MNDILDLTKNENENERQYLWRIGGYIKTGHIKNWKEITPILNEQLRVDESEYRDESAYRKPVQYAEAYYEDVFSKMIDDQYANEIKLQKRELEKERVKLYSTKIEYSRDIRQQSRFELFYENVANEITVFDLPAFEKIEYCNDENEHIVTIADIHAGSNFITETNEYSFDECTRRFGVLLNHMIWYVKNNNISKLKVLCLGDDIQGILRISDLKLNESSVVRATVFVAKAIAQFLNDLSSYCEIDYYHCPTSNHSQLRPLNSKASEIASEDVEYIIGNYIKDVLVNNDRIEINTNFGYEYIEIPIFDFKTIAMHGHQIKSIENSLKDLSYQKKVFYDTVFLAHFHGGKEIVVGETSTNDTEVLVCPSFVGSCPYAEKIMKGAKPACKVFVFNKKYGHTDTHKIILN